jgi:hypothetical protein
MRVRMNAEVSTTEHSTNEARLKLACLALIALAGLLVGWNKGQLPRRELVALAAAGDTAPDLALYHAIVADVRGGRDYYDAAHERIQQFGFPISSPFNWRLPTYAWLFSLLPNKCWIQAVLLLLGAAGLVLTFAAERSTSNVAQAAVATFFMFGIFRWVLDGDAYLAQEVWAGVLIMISVAALRFEAWRWRLLAALAGIVALMFRELALPYCLAAGGVALWQRRYWEAVLWAKGLVVFGCLLAWHVFAVRGELVEHGHAPIGGAGLAQWIRCGGLDFVLLTVRMNSLLFHWPASLLWVYLLVALLGLAQRSDFASRTSCLAALLYLLAFGVVGRAENFYWGLLYAPLLPAGLAAGVLAVKQCWIASLPAENPITNADPA